MPFTTASPSLLQTSEEGVMNQHNSTLPAMHRDTIESIPHQHGNEPH